MFPIKVLRINFPPEADWVLVAVSKPPLRSDIGVGTMDLILEILTVFLRLNPSSRLDLEPDCRRSRHFLAGKDLKQLLVIGELNLFTLCKENVLI